MESRWELTEVRLMESAVAPWCVNEANKLSRNYAAGLRKQATIRGIIACDR